MKLEVFLALDDKLGIVTESFTSQYKAEQYASHSKNITLQKVLVDVPEASIKEQKHLADKTEPKIEPIKKVLYEYMEYALQLNKGNRAKTARDLQMSDTNFRYHLRKKDK